MMEKKNKRKKEKKETRRERMDGWDVGSDQLTGGATIAGSPHLMHDTCGCVSNDKLFTTHQHPSPPQPTHTLPLGPVRTDCERSDKGMRKGKQNEDGVCDEQTGKYRPM